MVFYDLELIALNGNFDQSIIYCCFVIYCCWCSCSVHFCRLLWSRRCNYLHLHVNWIKRVILSISDEFVCKTGNLYGLGRLNDYGSTLIVLYEVLKRFPFPTTQLLLCSMWMGFCSLLFHIDGVKFINSCVCILYCSMVCVCVQCVHTMHGPTINELWCGSSQLFY